MSAELATATGARRGSRHADYLRAAAQLFAERGYGGTSVEDVGSRLGVSGPAVYWHFASKEALLTEMLSDISDSLLEGGQRCVSQAGDDEDALTSLVRWQVQFALDHPELITVHARDLAHVPQPARQRIRRTQRLYAELWVGALGGIAPDVPEPLRRAATHAAIGLINSTPYIAANLNRTSVAALLEQMAVAALHRAVGVPPADEHRAQTGRGPFARG
ncbi:MAG TPA: TetR/AcrR family transcriptional regulator [Acidimicrobiales bacterium]|nr:TetR/AcrR family transcriptional regulator [Acidimicrobiales bacterium]